MVRWLPVTLLCLVTLILAACSGATPDGTADPEVTATTTAAPSTAVAPEESPRAGAPPEDATDGESEYAPPAPTAMPSTGPRERVELVVTGDLASAFDLLRQVGAEIEVHAGDRIQALVPEARIGALERSPLVEVERPGIVVPLQTGTTALEIMGADRWHAAGFTGHGVKVAILDRGFNGYLDAMGTTLPANVTVQSFRADASVGAATDHGLRVAEIVHRVAPGAQLYLVNFDTVTELSAAVDYLIEQEVAVVSFSLGYIHNGPGDGTGAVNEIVSRGTAAGQSWAVASGNWAEQHWAGPFRDTDGDSVHEFDSGSQQIGHHFNAGDLILVSLRWDDEWGAACSDYDIEVFGPGGALVGASRDIQDCEGDPVEDLQVLATEAGTYRLRIIEAHAEGTRQLDLMVVGSPDRGHPLEFAVAGGSLAEPADHPGVVTVGALGNISDGLLMEADFSSRGPTLDGRPKPNVLAPTGLCCGDPSIVASQADAFAGTSAAAPHVAGGLALLSEAFPGSTRSELTGRLLNRSVAAQPIAEGSLLARIANLGSLFGLGPLLPEDAASAMLLPELPATEGLAVLLYRGPDQYPLRFVHLLTDGRTPATVFRLDTSNQRFLAWIRGAPPWVSDFDAIPEGEVIIMRFDAPAP
ncbi:MAG: S8 family serine peptidase [Dehalococcoidia bacterium]|nr:S8 family serine peptidase [Dehalococcoidia bacterium]